MVNNFQYPSGATPLDPDEMEGLKLGHITTREELNRFEQDNINEALQWLENRHDSDILTEKFIKTLHKKMFAGFRSRWMTPIWWA
jgi:fido (protein-threonine AMPylation protein)